MFKAPRRKSPAGWSQEAGPSCTGVETLVSDRSHMPTAAELTTILRQFENAPDEAAALAGGCAWLQAQGEDVAVGIVCADGQKLVAASGWKAIDLAGEIAGIRTGTRDGCAVPIRYGGVHLGSVVARCGGIDRERIQRSAETLAVVCGSALRSRLEAIALRDQERDCAPEIIGRSPAIADVRAAVARAGTTVFPILIEGESGTGKGARCSRVAQAQPATRSAVSGGELRGAHR